MSAVNNQCKKLTEEWHATFKKATDFDSWGQPVEAIQTYHQLASTLRAEATPDSPVLSDQQKKIANKVAACVELRRRDLQQHKIGDQCSISFADVKRLEEKFVSVVTIGNLREFPVEIRYSPGRLPLPLPPPPPFTQRSQSSNIPGDQDEIPSSEEIVNERTCGSILPPPDCPPGHTIVMLRIEKICLKDTSQFLDPFITISCKDMIGRDITSTQDTPIACSKDDTAVYFNTDLYLQKPLEFLPHYFAIFFEFKHYKPRKKQVSTRCWSFIERDEVKEGPIVAELYKKPTDIKRKKINLLTVKPLYLHLKLSFIA